MQPRFVFLTGGVLSSLGKGIGASVLGALLKARGLPVRLRKLDPYLNVDPGTMSPYEHGEVFVTDDGCETDLDFGHYERFIQTPTTKFDYITTGQIYQSVLRAERRGDYLGATVQVIPHVTQAIKDFMHNHLDPDVTLIAEIGGTVGDIEGLPFLEAVRQMKYAMPDRVCCIHMGWVPYMTTAGEYKTKPMQHSVKELQRAGIQPDILLLRCEGTLPKTVVDKIGLFANVPIPRVLMAQNQSHLLSVPLAYHKEGLDEAVVDYFHLKAPAPRLDVWKDLETRMRDSEPVGTLAIVAKYGHLQDAYRSLLEALMHAGLHEGGQVTLRWIDPDEVDDAFLQTLDDIDGVLVPGSFGERGHQGILSMIRWARETQTPFLGICAGMQFAVIEAARHLLGWEQADSEEFTSSGPLVIRQLTDWDQQGEKKSYHAHDGLGGTMRLGAYPCVLSKGSRVHALYGQENISERHRHRFEVDIRHRDALTSVGLLTTGLSPCGRLPEVVERCDHPFFVASQFHPEFKSSPLAPHPLFCGLVRCIKKCWHEAKANPRERVRAVRQPQ
ncbi:CTP synthase [Candidatus Hepatobacter penaei]|uniref:CTP synthase n=1 Tax=Candidatus Hepatobacter penaei TaxID=1274402 RepID=UPI0009E24AFC|nr:CTP synthase [Candidatus Hepatobacter penaei]